MVEKEDISGLADGVILDTLRSWYESYVNEKREQNDRARRDAAYRDGDQWTEKERAKNAKRGAPSVTINLIQPKVNYILGREVRTRVNPDAKPRTPEHKDAAPAMTDALRYVDDKNDFDTIRSFCTEDSFTYGACASISVVEDGEVIEKRIPWRQFFYDPKSLEPNFSDSLFFGIANWWDLEDAQRDSRYVDRAHVLEESHNSAASNGPFENTHSDEPESVWNDRARKRIKVCEIYWKKFHEGTGRKEWHLAHYTGSGFLVDPQLVPWVDDTKEKKTFCPITATSCFVIQTGKFAGERYGLIRIQISPQDEVNHRRSRALNLLNGYGFIAEEGAVPDVDSFLTELSKADCAAVVNNGALLNGKIQMRSNTELGQAQLQLLQEAKAEITATGPSAPTVAGDESVLSGRAIIARESLGLMELERPFDNIRKWQLKMYRKRWWLIRQTWTGERWLRVRDSVNREGFRFVGINRQMTRGERLKELVQEEVPFESAIGQLGVPTSKVQQLVQQARQVSQQQVQQVAAQMQQAGQQPDPQALQAQQQRTSSAIIEQSPFMNEPFNVNDIARAEMDIVIDVAPDTSIAAQEEADKLLEVIGRGIPSTSLPFLKAWLENSDLKGKDALIAAVDRPPDPAQVQQQQQQIQMQMQMMQAQIQTLAANAQLTMAKAQTEQTVAQQNQVETQILPAEKQAEIQKNQAQAMHSAASAGEKTGATQPAGGQTLGGFGS